MSKRRIVLTDLQYRELTESRDWCVRNGMFGFRDFYNQELGFLASRGALPPGAIEYRRNDEER